MTDIFGTTLTGNPPESPDSLTMEKMRAVMALAPPPPPTLHASPYLQNGDVYELRDPISGRVSIIYWLDYLL